jgi:transcriptional regulator with XRE-family HTH domain
MGHARPRPQRLAQKLLQIRTTLGLSQGQIAKQIGLVDYTVVSKYEHDVNEPSLMTLLAYSRFAGVRVEDLIDDALNLEF